MGIEHRSLQENAIVRAVKILEAAGVSKFWIELDGQEWGELPRGVRVKSFDYMPYYEEVFSKLEPGQQVRIQVPTDELERHGIKRGIFKDRIRSAAGNRFGRGNWVVGSDPDITYVDVLRIE